MTMNQILIVDDQHENCQAITTMLEGLDVSISFCHRGVDALKHIRDVAPSLVLLDADMPNMDGYQVINQMWSDDDLRQIPVLLMTTHFADRKQLMHQPLLEVVDALPKPINPEMLQQRVVMALKLKAHQQKIVSILDDGGEAIRKRHEAVLAVDTAGRITFANATALALLRTNHQMIFGVYLESIFEEPNHHVNSAWQEHPIQNVCAQGNVLQVESCLLYCADGNTIRVKLAAIPIDTQGDLALMLAFRQIGSSEAEQDADSNIAVLNLQHYDPLTGTYTRQAFEQVIDDRIAKNQVLDKKIAVLQIDLAHFNHVNESLGHEVGDRMLKDVVSRIQKSIRPTDKIGRIGGDVFALMIDDVAHHKNIGRVAQKIIDALKISFLLEGFELFIGCNLGISTFPECGKLSGALLKNAAIAVESAKLMGANSYHFFTAKMNNEMLARVELEASLRRASERDEFEAQIVPLTLNDATAIFSQAEQIFELQLVWHNERFGCTTANGLLDLFERYAAYDLYAQLLSGAVEQFCEKAADNNLVLILPITLRALLKDNFAALIEDLVTNLQKPYLGWMLQEEGLGRLLPEVGETFDKLISEGYRIGIGLDDGDYLSRSLNRLNICFLRLVQPKATGSAANTLLHQALMGVVKQLDIAILR